MEKYITDPRTGLDYELVGNYYLIAGDDGPALGLWGQRRLRYLKAHRPFLYDDLLLSGQLEQHLHAIDADAAAMADRLTAQLSRAEPHRSPEGRRSPDLGPGHEQHPSPGAGDGERRTDPQLITSAAQQLATRQAAFFCCFYFSIKV